METILSKQMVNLSFYFDYREILLKTRSLVKVLITGLMEGK